MVIELDYCLEWIIFHDQKSWLWQSLIIQQKDPAERPLHCIALNHIWLSLTRIHNLTSESTGNNTTSSWFCPIKTTFIFAIGLLFVLCWSSGIKCEIRGGVTFEISHINYFRNCTNNNGPKPPQKKQSYIWQHMVSTNKGSIIKIYFHKNWALGCPLEGSSPRADIQIKPNCCTLFLCYDCCCWN